MNEVIAKGKRRVRVKANEVSDVDVEYVSLVKRAASRIPVRILKTENVPDEETNMIDLGLKSLFSGIRKAEGPRIAALVLNPEIDDKDDVLAGIADAGFGIENLEERDGALLVKQDDDSIDDTVLIKMNDNVAALVRVEKGFDPPYLSDSFAENLSGNTFHPSVMMATDALVDTIQGSLMKSSNRGDLAASLEKAIGDYQSYVVNLVTNMPDTLFKFDAASYAHRPMNPVRKETEAEAEAETEAATGSAAATGAETEATSDTETQAEGTDDNTTVDDAEARADAQAALDAEPATGTEEGATEAAAEDEQTETVAETSTETEAASDEPAGVDGVEVTKSAGMNTDEMKNMFAELIKSQLSESLTPVVEKVDGLAKRVEQSEKSTIELRKAVKGTVVSEEVQNDDFLGNLGARHRVNGSVKKADTGDELWQGTALDRLVS